MIYQQNVTEKPFDIKSVPTVDVSHTETSKGNEFFSLNQVTDLGLGVG
jgi:hypothetical protein